MCGIIGWSGSNPKRFNKQKFDILGLFNNSRGGDSCGVSTDGEIYYGTLASKNYDDFIINKGYLVPQLVPAVIGHMRKASVGGVSETNAHPFGFGSLDDGFEFVGCHNGTLSNYEELAKKYDVEAAVFSDEHRFVRNKVDSEVLLEILYKTRDIKVLDEYIGGAAILFQNLNDPTTLYAFHGASRREQGDRIETLVEERPLFYYQESKDSVYISSMEEALLFIGGVKDETVFEFDHNIVYRIENGSVTKAAKLKVNRKEAGQRKSYAAGFTTGGRGTAATINDYSRSHRNRGKKKDRSKTKRLKRLESVINIYDETIIEGDYPSAIYYNKLRYWRNGHLITGVYTYIKSYGFYKIGDVAADANNKLYRLMGEHFSLKAGEFVPEKIVDDVSKTDDTLFIAFDYGMKEPPVFFLYEGIMLETIYDFIAVTGVKKFSFENLSTMSKYPICRIGKHRFPDDKQGIMYNAQMYSNNFQPLQSNHIYNIEKGNLLNIDRFEEEVIKEAEVCCSLIGLPEGRDRDPIQIPLKFEVPETPNPQVKHETGLKNFMDKPTKEFLDEDPPIDIFVSPEEDDKVFEVLNNHVMPIYEQMQICNENLKNEDNEVIQDIVELQKDFMISIDCIIESKEK